MIAWLEVPGRLVNVSGVEYVADRQPLTGAPGCVLAVDGEVGTHDLPRSFAAVAATLPGTFMDAETIDALDLGRPGTRSRAKVNPSLVVAARDVRPGYCVVTFASGRELVLTQSASTVGT